MHKNSNNQLVFSPSDLVLAMRSPFASWMDRLAIESPTMIAGIEKGHDPMMALLATKGSGSFLCDLKHSYIKDLDILVFIKKHQLMYVSGEILA